MDVITLYCYLKKEFRIIPSSLSATEWYLFIVPSGISLCKVSNNRGPYMLDKIVTKEFRKMLEKAIEDIRIQQTRTTEKEFEKDKKRIMKDLLTQVRGYPPDVVLDEDYYVAAIDGSGNENFGMIDDVRIHLVSTAAVVLYTNTKSGEFFTPLSSNELQQKLGEEQPKLDVLWHLGVRESATKHLAEMLEDIYHIPDIADLVLPFFQDSQNTDFQSLTDLANTEFGRFIKDLENYEGLISREHLLSGHAIHDELRKSAEYAAAKRVIDSDINPRFLLLDGALSVFIHFVRKYPSMPSGFMLRYLCKLARQKGIILCAISKNHTIPFAHRIAQMAEEKFGKGAKWFCLLPSHLDPGGGLHIYEDRTYIPPRLAVPYLFSFSGENRPSRIDFDRIWWLENIFVEGDPETTRENELSLFRELEFMSRDARWYGYPVALALAHNECKVSYEDLKIAKDVLADVLRGAGYDERMAKSLRSDYNM